MTFKIKPTEQTLLDTLADESLDVNSTGIFVQPSTQIATTIYPLAGFTALLPTIQTKAKDAIIGQLAPVIRRTVPFFAQSSNLSPAFTMSSGVGTSLLSYTFAEPFEVSRGAEVVVNGTCFANAINNRFDFWLDVNGTVSSTFKFFFNEATAHRSFVGSWVVTLPTATPVTITLYGARGSGASSIQLNSDDFVNMTIKG